MKSKTDIIIKIVNWILILLISFGLIRIFPLIIQSLSNKKSKSDTENSIISSKTQPQKDSTPIISKDNSKTKGIEGWIMYGQLDKSNHYTNTKEFYDENDKQIIDYLLFTKSRFITFKPNDKDKSKFRIYPKPIYEIKSAIDSITYYHNFNKKIVVTETKIDEKANDSHHKKVWLKLKIFDEIKK